MTDDELKSIENYLVKIFKNDNFELKKRKSIEDSCEVYLTNEFLGLIYKETDEGEDDFQFHMTILKEDLQN